ncbi:MAG: PQQ-binding-like beta-propeller repeat protein [Pirellulales bacterium]
MLRSLALIVVGLFLLTVAVAAERKAPVNKDSSEIGESDWPCWRGPNHNGVADARQNPPLRWSETENVVWQSNVPGRGHGSPIVVGDQVFLATAESDRQTQSVLCFDRRTGKQMWQTDVHRGPLETKGNSKSSLASSTLACDGQRLFINFLHQGAIYTTALSRDGKQLWQTKITDYVLHQGFGSSPALHGPLVIVSADNKGTGLVCGLSREKGEFVWKRERPQMPNYTSPIILTVAGRQQLLFTGCELVTSLDPATGKQLWEVEGSTTECVTSTVTDGELVFTSGGYPKNHMSAVKADGSGQITWENNSRVYVPSMLVRDGFLYTILDEGLAVCWNCADGKEVWRGRLPGTFSASPVLVGDRIFATSEAGQTYIFGATPDGFDLLAENQLGEEVLSTPTICGSRIYLRAANMDDDMRQEVLYCVGEE